MAKMTMDFDPLDALGGLAKIVDNTEGLASKMVDAGLDVMAREIKSGASRHRVTGHMAESVGKSKPRLNKDGDMVGRVKFYGSDGVSRSKKGKKFDRTNWIKAFRIEYGRSGQPAQPFVRPAIQRSKSAISNAMQKKFEEATK